MNCMCSGDPRRLPSRKWSGQAAFQKAAAAAVPSEHWGTETGGRKGQLQWSKGEPVRPESFIGRRPVSQQKVLHIPDR